jgi:translation initiation factor 5
MGSHRPEDLAKLLDKFIVKYVLCSSCHYPELRIDVVKKDLISTCNACGKKAKLDMLHKAGKQLYKDMPTLLKSNPEFKGKINKNQEPSEESSDLVQGGKKKKNRKNQAGESNDPEMIEEVEVKVSREDDLIKQALEVGAEINVIDAKELTLDSDELGK